MLRQFTLWLMILTHLSHGRTHEISRKSAKFCTSYATSLEGFSGIIPVQKNENQSGIELELLTLPSLNQKGKSLIR
tara:strand:+ start:397 stop:624 length:228 start_codon:yes stop_codon:yes gene_type:complete